MALNWSQEIYVKAFRFAAEAHQGQKFPGTELPYILHVNLVTMEVIAALMEEPYHNGNLAVQCALLHDVIEDTDFGYEDLKIRFGQAVAEGVLALTKNEGLPKDDRMLDSLSRIQKQSQEIWLVKLADRITNLAEPPAYWSIEKRQKYLEEAEKIHAALYQASPFLSKRMKRRMKTYAQYL